MGTYCNPTRRMAVLNFSLNLRLLSVLFLALTTIASAHAGNGYAGRTSLTGQPAIQWPDYPAGAQPLAEKGARIAGGQRYAGYRFRSGIAVEASRYSVGAESSRRSADAVGITGIVSLPLTDRLSASGKAGLYVSESELSGSIGKPEALAPGTLVGAGLSINATKKLAFNLEAQRLQSAASTLSAIPNHSVFVGARLRF